MTGGGGGGGEDSGGGGGACTQNSDCQTKDSGATCDTGADPTTCTCATPWIGATCTCDPTTCGTGGSCSSTEPLTCECATGYSLVGESCVDTDECTVNEPCDGLLYSNGNAGCTESSTDGSIGLGKFKCTCNQHYEWNSVTSACDACTSGASGTYTTGAGQSCKSCTGFGSDFINSQCCDAGNLATDPCLTLKTACSGTCASS